MLANGIERRFQEVDVVHARNLRRILHRQENTFPGPILGRHRQKIFPFVGDGSRSHQEARPAGQHVRQRRFAGAVRPHDRVHLARVDVKVDTAKDLFAIDAGV